MNITVDAQEPKEDSLQVTLTIAADDVDRAVKQAYREISNRYTFQGFRRGRTPRPVIDAQVGREAVLADATNEVLNDAEPQLLTELDVVPVGRVDYGEDVQPVTEHEDYVIDATIALTPSGELSSYEPVAIDLPPEEATDAEVESQVNILMGYQTHFHEVEEDRPVQEEDFVTVAIENVNGAERYEDENRLIQVGSGLYPEALEQALVGMRVGESKTVSFEIESPVSSLGDEDEAEQEPVEATAEVTIKGIREQHIPELTDELANESFGFESVEAFKEGLAQEIEQDKKQRLPQLKEDRILAALTQRLDVDELPQAYLDDVYNGLVNQVLDDLQAQGATLELYLQSRGITPQQFAADLRVQAAEHARQSVALDALVRERGIEVTEDDVKAEMKTAGVDDVDEFYEAMAERGRLPELRRSVRRSKALDWLKESAEVTIVDEVARAQEVEASEAEDEEPDEDEVEIEIEAETE